MAQIKSRSPCCPDCFKSKGVRLVLQHRIHDMVFKCYSCGFEMNDYEKHDNSWTIPFIGDIKVPWESYIDNEWKEPYTLTFKEQIEKFVEGFKYLECRKYPRLDGSDNEYFCPNCGRALVALSYYGYAGQSQWGFQSQFANTYKCYDCAKRAQFKYLFGLGELNVKTVQMCKTYQDTIVEIKIIGIPKRGWWDENAKPLIEFLKKAIPPTEREYDTVTNIWSFDVKYWENIEQLFTLLGWSVQVVKSLSGKGQDVPGVHVPEDYAANFHYKQEVISTQETAENIAKQLSKFLGVEIIAQDLKDLKKLYRAKALELHPDRGGDAAAMSELNRLWTLYTAGGIQ